MSQATRQKSDRRVQQQPQIRQNPGELQAEVSLAQERAVPGGMTAGAAAASAPQASSARPYGSDNTSLGMESALDMDVTVLAFAQWVSEMKSRQSNTTKSLQVELNTIKNSINGNHLDLSDFKRHGAAIQQQMQAETNEIRESLSAVFMEITSAVRNNTAADQDLKLKIQSLNEQAVRNETAFAQLADAADQSQSKLKQAVQDMQQTSERMRDDLLGLNQHTEILQTTVNDRSERLGDDMDQIAQELRSQMERRKDQLKKMVQDVVVIGESLTVLKADLGDVRQGAGTTQSRLQSTLYSMDQHQRREASSSAYHQPTAQRQTLVAMPQARTIPYQAQPHYPGMTSAMSMGSVVYHR
mmetsp:Transcript_100467/g.181305  ORF Transcript_100467/g.181305 Transcript_100467/m.181305 type:complete len:356 (-) Transcript_100467:59-1126(-)